MAERDITFLGPRGTYSHLVAEKRFGAGASLLPLPSVLEVCTHVSRHPGSTGIVPIENSSGGSINETVDILLENQPRIYIEEELSLKVNLALMGRRNEKPRVLYSHFAPLEHSSEWIRTQLPRIEKKVVSSTAVAALWAAAETGAVALGNRRLARMYGLDVLVYPVQADIPNLTSFIVISGRKPRPEDPTKTTLAVRIPNRPGSLYTLLGTFERQHVNLSRLISRPIRGCPKEYAFLIDVSAGSSNPALRRALVNARKAATDIRVAGSYPCRRPYTS